MRFLIFPSVFFFSEITHSYLNLDNQMEQLDASNGLLQPLAKESRRASTLNAVIHYVKNFFEKKKKESFSFLKTYFL